MLAQYILESENMRLRLLINALCNLTLFFFAFNMIYASAFAFYIQRTGATMYIAQQLPNARITGNNMHHLALDVEVIKIKPIDDFLVEGQYFEYEVENGYTIMNLRYEVLKKYKNGYLMKGTAKNTGVQNTVEEKFIVDKNTMQAASAGYMSALWDAYVAV